MGLPSLLTGLQDAGAAAPPQAGPGWHTVAGGSPWYAWIFIVVCFAGLAYLVYRALENRRLYRLDRALPIGARAEVSAAVRQAEETTVGEIVPVVLGRSDRYPAADLWSGILFALAAYLVIWALPVEPGPSGFLTISLLAGCAGWLLSRSLPELRRCFVAPWRAAELADEQAVQEFFRLGLHRTEGRTGVLLFVSLFERRVVVLGDEGIDAKVPADTWRELHGVILAAARQERLAEGLVDAVGRMGAILHQHFPWQEGDRNELPDRLVVRKE